MVLPILRYSCDVQHLARIHYAVAKSFLNKTVRDLPEFASCVTNGALTPICSCSQLNARIAVE